MIQYWCDRSQVVQEHQVVIFKLYFLSLQSRNGIRREGKCSTNLLQITHPRKILMVVINYFQMVFLRVMGEGFTVG